MSGIKSYIPDKKFVKVYLYMALPLILQNMISASVKLVDNIMVGRLGGDAMGAVASVNKTIFIPELAFVGVLAGFGIFTSQYFGDKNADRVKQTFRAKVVGSSIFAVLAVVISYLFMDNIIGLTLSNSDALGMAETYFTYMLPYYFVLAIAMSYYFTYREVGYTKIIIIGSLAAIFTNTTLNFLLIEGNLGFPELGVKGAAIATVTARTVECIILMTYAKMKNVIFYSKLKDMFKIDKELLIEARPKVNFMLMNEIAYAVVSFVVYYAYNTRGDYQAAISIADTVNQFIFAFFSGVTVVVTIQVGKVLGSGDLDLARSNANKLLTTSLFLSIGIGLVAMLLSPLIVNIPLYDVTDETRDIALKLVFIDAISIPLFTIAYCFYFIFRSGGDTVSMAMMDLAFMTLLVMPVFLLLAQYSSLTVTQMKLAYSGLEVLKLSFATYRYKKRVWLRKIV